MKKGVLLLLIFTSCFFFLFFLPDAVNLMVVVAEVMGSVHVLDFEQ